MTHPAATTVALRPGPGRVQFFREVRLVGHVRLSFGIHRLTQGLSTPGTNSPDPTAQWSHAEIAKRACTGAPTTSSTRSSPGAAQAPGSPPPTTTSA